MLIDFNQELIGHDGELLKGPAEKEGGEGKALTLGWSCCQALMANYQGDKDETEKKLSRFFLAQKIHGSTKLDKGPINVTVEEVASIKELIGKSYGTAIIGPTYCLLDPKDKKESTGLKLVKKE